MSASSNKPTTYTESTQNAPPSTTNATKPPVVANAVDAEDTQNAPPAATNATATGNVPPVVTNAVLPKPVIFPNRGVDLALPIQMEDEA